MKRKEITFGLALILCAVVNAQTTQPAEPRARRFSNGPDPVMVLDSISALIKAHPDSVELYTTRAEKIYRYTLRRGDGAGDKYKKDDLFGDMDKAISLRPSDPALVVARGDYYYEALEDTTAALRDMDKALELDPNDPRTFEARGTLFVKMGDYTRACQEFTAGSALGDKQCRESMGRFCPRR